MAATNCKQNSRPGGTGEIVTVANGEETVVAIPVVVPPIEVALGVVPV